MQSTTDSGHSPSMLKGLSRIRPWLSDLICLLIFGIGVFSRWQYILVKHNPSRFIDPEMKTYIDAAKVWFTPGYVLKPSDVFLPPGAAYLFSSLFHVDPTMQLASRFMFVAASLVPIVFAGLAWAAFGKRTAKGTLIITSLYPPLITYGGFYFLEIPLALLLGLTMALYLWAGKMKSLRAALVMATASGFFLSMAMGFRLAALPAMIIFVAIFTLFFDGLSHPTLDVAKDAPAASDEPPRWPAFAEPARRAKRLLLVCLIAGALPLTITMSARCTIGNGNNFCFVSNRSSAEFLLGHYGRIESITWAPPQAPAVELATGGGPGHAYTERKKLAFAATDAKSNIGTARYWISHNVAETFLLSAEHVYDTFGGAFTWPKVAKDSWLVWEASQFYFVLFILLPAFFLMISVRVHRGFRAFLRSGEFLILSPLLGLLAAVIVSTGEERYRIPFEGLFIIGAVVFYQHFLAKTSDIESTVMSAVSPAMGSLRKLRARVKPWHTDVLCALIYLGGVGHKWWFITKFHDPRKFVFSDPATYVSIAERWIKPDAKPSWVDAMVPPGIGYFLAGLFKLDSTKWIAVCAMFLLTSLIPLAFFALAWGLFGKPIAKGTLVIMSFYMPLIAYGGFFMTEVPLTILLTLSLCAFVGAMRVKARWKTLCLAVLAGFLASLAASFKLTALPSVAIFALVTLFFYEGPVGGASAVQSVESVESVESATEPAPKRRWFNLSGPMRAIKLITVAGVFAGALPLMVAMSVRCTRINEGKYCLVCTNAQQNFLLGHYGRISSVTWKTRAGVFAFGSSAAAQHSYHVKKEVPFGVNDGEKNTAEGWKWMRQNPDEAVVLVIEHVFDTYGGSVAWPPNVTYAWLPSQLSQYGLLFFFMVPALWLATEIARKRGLQGLLASREFLVLSPNLGVIASVLASTGEARYRIPLDGFIVIVGVQFYHRYFFSTPAHVAGMSPPPELDAAKPEPTLLL